MKFIADGMLGKLTRWLRILGQDVKYSSKLDDSQLIDISKKERRALLTRDLELYKHATARGVEAFYLEGQTGEEKLAEIAEKFSLDLQISMAVSRCPKCNTVVVPVSKEEIARNVEKSTFDHYQDFWRCRKCRQVYWQGAHWTGILKTLKKANAILEKTHNAKA